MNRYSLDRCEPEMYLDNDGEWVKYEDAKKLCDIISNSIKRVHADKPCQFCAKGVLLCLLDDGKCYLEHTYDLV